METIIISLLLLIAAETTYVATTQLVTTKRKTKAPVFIDTSVLIDGRIIAIAQSGFLTRPLYIPRSVVGELQFLADHADADKRARARHGLDVINQLQALTTVTVTIFSDGVHAEEGVDNRLLTLAKKHHGSLCTIDYNLNKVAVVEGIEVLNVNDLAKTLRMAYLPGEKTMLEIAQKGNDSQQGVGHLADGTMVVVEQAGKLIGATVEVEFVRSLQTAAGKMMFAKLTHEAKPTRSQKSRGQEPQRKKQRVDEVTRKTTQPQRPQNASSEQANQNQQRKSRPNAQQRTAGYRSSKRRTPEDTLVDLANRQS